MKRAPQIAILDMRSSGPAYRPEALSFAPKDRRCLPRYGEPNLDVTLVVGLFLENNPCLFRGSLYN